jgi:hypothetical protein
LDDLFQGEAQGRRIEGFLSGLGVAVDGERGVGGRIVVLVLADRNCISHFCTAQRDPGFFLQG